MIFCSTLEIEDATWRCSFHLIEFEGGVVVIQPEVVLTVMLFGPYTDPTIRYRWAISPHLPLDFFPVIDGVRVAAR